MTKPSPSSAGSAARPRSRFRRTGRVFGVTAVLGLAAAGISYAAIPDGSGIIHGCYNNTSGALKVIDSATVSTCPTGTTKLNWNQKGPRGLQGIQGPAGISEGISGTSSTSVPLNQANTLTPVLSATSGAPVAGTYFVNASVMLDVAQGHTVRCILSGPG